MKNIRQILSSILCASILLGCLTACSEDGSQSEVSMKEDTVSAEQTHTSKPETTAAVTERRYAMPDREKALYSSYDAPYYVPDDDRLASQTPEQFNAANYPQLPILEEDFSDTDYGTLQLNFGPNSEIVTEGGYGDNGGCVKVTGDVHAMMTYKAAPGEFKAGDWLIFTAMVKGEDISGSGNYRNILSIYDDNNKWINESHTSLKKSSDWVEMQQLVQITETANALKTPEYYNIRLGAYMNGLEGTAYFDNYKLTRVIFPPMNTVLMSPNYKGIIRGEGGEGDIMLRAYVDDANGYFDFDNFSITSQIVDTEGNVLLTSSSDEVTPTMDFCFSSSSLKMDSDYYLETHLYDKTTGEPIVMRDWILRKRDADYETVIGYDEYGRITKNGEPFFPISHYGLSPYEDYTKAFIESEVIDSALHSGMGWYYNWASDPTTRGYIEEMAANGIDIWLAMGDMRMGGGSDVVYNRVKNYSDIRGLTTKIVNNFNDLPFLFAYYLFDEKNPVQYGDEISWVNKIIDSLDINHPTAGACDYTYAQKPGAYSRTVDFIGYDPYPVTGKETQDISLVYDRITEGKRTNPNRPVYLIPQGFWFAKRGDLRGPNEAEFRNMIFQGIIAGACMVCTYCYTDMANNPSPGLTAEQEWAQYVNVYREVQELENVIISVEPAPYYEIENGGDWLNTMTKRYDGKSYLFAVNNQNSANSAAFTLEGVTEIKGRMSGKTYTSADGKFNVEFDPYMTEVFEFEQADYKSSHAELIRFGADGCIVNNSETDTPSVVIPEGMKNITFRAVISDNAQLYINGEKYENTGSIAVAGLDSITVKVVSEDGRFETECVYAVS